MHYSVSLAVPTVTMSSPAQICSGVFGDSRHNEFDFVVLDPLCRRKVTGIILGIFDVLFIISYYRN